MSIDTVRAALASDAPFIAIEAPAGCGKTFEAAQIAVQIAGVIGRQQEVLLLAHTNGAVQEFRSRVGGALVRATTLDSFALELLRPHARALNLADPIRPGTVGGPKFSDLAPKVVELFTRAPSVAKAVAEHYPYIILDEHQDARAPQHAMIRILLGTGKVRVRAFGDPMQDIYGFSGGEAAGWDEMVREATGLERLETPHRWQEHPDLGRWILKAREVLKSGGRLSISELPSEVEVVTVPNVSDAPSPRSRSVPSYLVGELARRFSAMEDRVAILVRNNDHAFGISAGLPFTGYRVYEGVSPTTAYDTAAEVANVSHSSQGLAQLMVALMGECCTGLTAELKGLLGRAIVPSELVSRSTRIAALLGTLEPLYVAPSPQTFGAVLRKFLERPPEPLRLHKPEAMRVLSELRHLAEGEDPRDLVDRVAGGRRFRVSVPKRCVTTIHKAKGREFDHVILMHCGRRTYSDSVEGRRLLYVALSRACKSITLVRPGDAATPLLEG